MPIDSIIFACEGHKRQLDEFAESGKAMSPTEIREDIQSLMQAVAELAKYLKALHEAQ